MKVLFSLDLLKVQIVNINRHNNQVIIDLDETKLSNKTASQERSKQTAQISSSVHRFCRLRLENVLKSVSFLLLPLALGILTVVITF